MIRTFPDEPAEAAGVAKRCAELIAAGTPAREIAVLFRTNAQSEAYEAALAEAGVAYIVQGAERFFERSEVRQAMVALRAATRTAEEASLRETVVTVLAAAVNWRPDEPPPGGAARERWQALAALVELAESFGDDRGLAEFTEELARRAAMQHAPTVDGVTLASLHSAKGLEWDAVFLVGLVEGVLPTTYAKTPEAVEEERRLLYVGITRARQWLSLSYSATRNPGGGRQRRPSRFLPIADRRRGSEPAQGDPRSRRHAAPRHRHPVPGLWRGAHRGGAAQAGPMRHLSVHNGRRVVRAAEAVAQRSGRRRRGYRRTWCSPTPP